MEKKEVKKLILTIILVIVISIIVFLIGQYIVNKNRKYTGSMIGKYISYSTDSGEPTGDYLYVILYSNASCEIGSTWSGPSGYDCIYFRTDYEITLHYQPIYGNTYKNKTYKITPEGNLNEELFGLTYYRQ